MTEEDEDMGLICDAFADRDQLLTADYLASVTGLPRERVDAALDALRERGSVERKASISGDGITYRWRLNWRLGVIDSA